MATEKILNTRIQLKYDTLANWNNSTFILKKGEVAVVTVPTAEGSTLEPVMFKVGDGAKTFKQLDWASAKAADVYSWAKQSGISVVETAGTNDGSYVTGLKWENNQLVPEIVAFDTTMSTTSTNAVQNKVVKKYVDDAVAGVVAGEVKNAEYATAAGKATNDGAGNNIVNTYATKAEIEAQKDLWTKDTVTKVTDDDKAIEVSTTDTLLEGADITYTVKLKINEGTPGNVTLTQDANGLKANTTPAAIGAVSTNDFNTFKTGNTTAIGTAKSEAIATAAEDATTKANTAKSEAIAAAAEDATTKANTAESNAKEYTNDEIVGLELEHSGQSIILKNKAGTTVATLDASAFYVDGMVSDATYDATTNKLTITFNTAAGKNAIDVDLNDLVDVYTDGTGITVGTDGKISITDGGVGTTQLANNAVTTEKILDGNVTKAKLHSDVQASLDKADSALQEVKWQKNNSADDTYFLSTDTSITIPSKDYVDDAIAGVVGGEVTNAKYAENAGKLGGFTYSDLLTAAATNTTSEIEKLNVTDTAETNEYVSAVSETDGKISVSRETLPVYSVTAENKPQTVTIIGGGSRATSGKVLKVNGTELVEIISTEAVSEIAAESIRTLDYNTKTSNHIEATANYGALVDFTVEDGLITTIERNPKLTGYIEDLDQRESTVLVLFGGSATENI